MGCGPEATPRATHLLPQLGNGAFVCGDGLLTLRPRLLRAGLRGRHALLRLRVRPLQLSLQLLNPAMLAFPAALKLPPPVGSALLRLAELLGLWGRERRSFAHRSRARGAGGRREGGYTHVFLAQLLQRGVMRVSLLHERALHAVQ